MSRKCELTGVGVQFGNMVSHSQRKTRRSFRPNMRMVRYVSDLTGKRYKLRVAASAIRTVEKNGGFDGFMLSADASKMSVTARQIQAEIMKKSVA